MKLKLIISCVLSLIVLSVFVFANDLNNKKNNSSDKSGYRSDISNNKVVVRVKKEYAGTFNPETDFAITGVKVTSQNSLLKPSQSLLFNKKLKAQTQTKPHKNIQKILEAEEPLLRSYVVEFVSDETPQTFCKKILNRHPEIEIAEPYYLAAVNAMPNDPYASQQTMLQTINAFAAWDIEPGDTNVIIGISDSGIDQHHEDLKNSIAPNWVDPINGIDDDGNGYTDDFDGFDLAGDNEPPSNTFHSDSHGTHVAGMADATVNNATGMAGVANKCRFFPIKCMKKGQSQYLDYGYESLIYSAKRGFKVVNCSWGNVKPFSQIEQSIINFAVANDVAIVASGGNDNGSYDDNYPAAYDLVLAVGEVNQADIFSGDNIGDYLDILAPGGGNWHTNPNGGYSNGGIGSSYASPVVAGVVALIRSKYPELDALQSLELVRQSAVDVSGINGNQLWKDILPRRVDAYKAVTTDPFSIPSIRPRKAVYTNSIGIESNRFGIADTITLKFDCHNYLGSATNLKFVLSAVKDDNNSIAVVDSILEIEQIDKESDFNLEPFRFVIDSINYEKMFFRVDIYGVNNYHDYFLQEFIPSPIMTTFSNDSISFSAADIGAIGFGGVYGNRQGVGFVYKDYGNQIWKSCFIAGDYEGHYPNSLFWNRESGAYIDFEFLKQLIPPDKNICIFNDSKADPSRYIGIEVKQEFIIPPGKQTVGNVNIEVKNTSGEKIVDFSSGYFFDWDLKNSDSNIVMLFPEAIPDQLQSYPCEVELIAYPSGKFPICGNAVVSSDQSAVALAAGLNNKIHDIDKFNIISDVFNNLNIQDLGVFDGAIFIGMKFPGDFEVDSVKKYTICFGCAEDENKFIQEIRIALDSTHTSVNQTEISGYNVSLFPNPASDYLNCMIESPEAAKIDLKIFDLLGREITNIKRSLNTPGSIRLPIDISNYGQGRYILAATIGGRTSIHPLVIIK